MFKDAVQAYKQLSTGTPMASIFLSFMGAWKVGEPVVATISQKHPVVFPINPPLGVSYGLYLPGKVPQNWFEHEQMQRDWMVLQTAADPKEVVLDHMPPLDTPIIVALKDRPDTVEGLVVRHQIADDGTERHEYVFMELIRAEDQKYAPPIRANLVVKFGRNGEIDRRAFIPHTFDSIVSWNYLGIDGEVVRPKRMRDCVELFVDCEFDDSTKSLISLGICTKHGKVYYAFDSREADKVKEPWIIENVNNVLMDVPPNAVCWDLAAKNLTFQDFLQFVIGHECAKGECDLIIHVDFPTDVAYISPLFHLGMGKRIGTMKKLQFHVDYVDAYPSKLKDAKQHNAAWDAVAIWFHLGYYSYMVMERMVMNSGTTSTTTT
jgi:hypothetical protein